MEELGRKLRYFQSEIKSSGIKPRVTKADDNGREKPLVIEEMETQLDDLEHDLRDVTRTYATLNRDASELIELKLVLENTADIFTKDAPAAQDALRNDEEAAIRARERLHERAPLTGGRTGFVELEQAQSQSQQGVKLGFVAGVIVREKMQAFERLLWRATRGNLFVRHVELPEPVVDPQTGAEETKNVVVIFFQGEQAEAKVKRICDSRGVHIYPCPDNSEDRAALLRQVDDRLAEMRDVLDKSRNHRDQLLHNLSAQLPAWRAKVLHEKAIYDTMNRFNYNVGRKCLVAVGWCPIARTDDVRAALKRGSERSGALTQSILSVVHTNEVPPTYFELNKVTSAFHAIVEAYGVASYREINPTPLTVVTFPFLFAIMFGDFGHGILMALFALGLILIEKRVDERTLDEIGGMIFSARYMLFAMGAFSMYVGLLYNEAFAVGLDFFGGSRWKVSNWPPEVDDTYQWCENSGVYPFGVDPQWKGVPNEITFYNSIKMKVSIIFGVVHMTIGIVFSMLNSIHFKKWYDLLFVNIPSLIFFVSMFGYLAFIIIFKWIVVPSDQPNLPKLMNVMIDMFLSPFSCCGNPEQDTINGQHDKYLDDFLYNGQPVVQGILFVLVAACVPVLLCGKPCMLWRDHRNRMKGKAGYEKLHAGDGASPVPDTASSHDEASKDARPEATAVVAIDDNVAHVVAPAAAAGGGGHGDGHGGHGEHFELSEVFMHQVIHAIEFILGAISNTASYLRLWALSLAHAELAIVFWERAFSLNLSGGAEESTASNMTTVSNSTTTAGLFTTAALAEDTTGEMMAEAHKQSVGTTTLYAFVGFSAWFGASLGVLMVMEALSAFLHALRLHWVEFQNKFLQGNGVKFAPFSFRALEDLAMTQQSDE